MSKRVRITCPACGMMVDQNMLNKDHDFQFVIQEIYNEGGQGGIRNRYTKSQVANSDGARVFQYMIAMKLLDKAEKLFDEIGEDITIEVHIPDEAEDEIEEIYEEAVVEPEVEAGYEPEAEAGYEPALEFETEIGGVKLEAELENEIGVEDVKRKPFWKRWFTSSEDKKS